ncbi:hypothetical protein VTL71DRAFT_15008 [Oculimacula yallundae]|uniref:Uncharacterized protein n=1 Tax=Oculimacula yallundae TaxID=86028 RepID=A0ABR4CFD1_9HELO
MPSGVILINKADSILDIRASVSSINKKG